MSGYRNYVPWNKSSGPNLNISATTKKDSTVQNKYESSHFDKSKPHQKEEKSATARIAAKYSSLNSSYQPRDISSYTNKSSSNSSSTSIGNKLINEKKESHPPVTYRPLVRTGARSRDPSPVDRSERTSTAYDYNKLYPARPYTRSVSRERTESTSSTSSTIPKYTGRSSISKEDVVPKYTGRSSTTREDTKYPRRSSINRDDVIPKYSGRTSMERSSNDVSKYVGRTSITKDDTLSRYKVGSRTTSREDLTSNSQKYINSRFLPKNSIEKSLTAYSRPSTARTNEVSRKNRELLNVLHAQQEQERISRPTSRCSSIALDEIPSSRKSYSNDSSSMSSSIDNSSEMETVNVVMRGTSPTLISHTRIRTSDIAKTLEKQITRAKKRGNMIDKEIQSDRLDDSTKSSRFSGASKISATPWSSFLDLKFSSPNMKDKFPNKAENNEVSDSPKSISRNSSSKSLSQSSSKSELKSKDNKKSPSPGPSTKSKVSPPKQQSDKKLPPVIPKSETKANSLHSLTQNKDFRKSVLNMNPDGKNKTKIGRRSNSVSSAESDAADLDATDVSENLSSCKSYHKTNSSSKLPQKVSSQGNSFRERRSPSAECNSTSSTATTSSSEDDTLSKNAKTEQIRSANSSRTSMILTSADELSIDKSSKPPLNPNQKAEHPKNEAEAKSFLMRALAPVTNLFKVKHQDSGEKINWMDNSDSGTDKNKSTSQRDSIFNTKPAKIVISKAESGERAWWLNENSNSPKNNSATSENSKQATLSKPTIRHVESGEAPWWLDENAEIPEGVETYPNYVKEDGTTVDGRVIYKLRKYESDESSWWNSSSKTSTDKSKTNAANIMDEEYLQKHKIRHIDSGERSWWISSSENVPEMVQAKENVRQIKPKYAIRHQDSGEKPWWLNQDTNEENENELENGIPLGDRASPEGLEMPKDDEGRLSPYDNVPIERSRNKKPTNLFISKHTNIDEILGGTTQLWSPIMDRIFGYGESGKEKCTEITADQVVIHEGMGQSKKKENKTISSKVRYVCLMVI